MKSSFYKNPSKAIEKGGGFYIPGLRGPRLRYFVGSAILALLALNLNGSPVPFASQPRSLLVSSAISVIGALAVIATAIQDSAAEAAEEAAAIAAARISSPQQRSSGERAMTTSEDSSSQGDALSNAGEDELLWVSAVVRDMLGCGVWVFRRDDADAMVCVLAEGDVLDVGIDGDQMIPGPVVERVAEEGRAIYVDDSLSLPDGIDFPFLRTVSDSPATWSVYVVPLPDDSGIMAAARPKAATITVADRRWIETLAERVGPVLA